MNQQNNSTKSLSNEQWVIDIDRTENPPIFWFRRYIGDRVLEHVRPNEQYAPCDASTASIYAAAIINGFEPPRLLTRLCKQSDGIQFEHKNPDSALDNSLNLQKIAATLQALSEAIQSISQR